MPASSSKPRTYNEKYLGRNGFTEKPTTRAQKLEVHQHALDIIRHCGVRLPSVETIMNTDWTKPAPETSASVQKEIDELRKRHGALLSRLYDLNASAYLDDVEDRYRSRNEVLDEDPREWMKREFKDSPKALGVNYSQAEVDAMIQISNAQKELYAKTFPYPFSPTAPTPAHLPSISRHNYDYCKQLIDLQRKLLSVKKEEEIRLQREHERLQQEMYNRQRWEEEARRQAQIEKDRLEKKFPTTVEEFYSKPMDFRNLIARFLDAGPLQDKQLRANNWTQEEVAPLKKIFNKDDKFRGQIIGMVMTIPKSISSDPRRKLP
ncbi:hypothetical protein C8R41DRAFT_835310 [Lentinula lateritia]|uniref:Uncharacterized protein n=1 Tax=Lentinula lateritia TaxID=40482 RepID=A0ABQ8VDN7_9AGAR|nr:hypothetical protein C8R41DRAFT_835310 [Lentinula lateritia]